MYTKIELSIVYELYEIYKEMNNTLDNLQDDVEDAKKCNKLYERRQNIVDNLVTFRVKFNIYDFIKQLNATSRLKIEKWKLCNKLDVYVNLHGNLEPILIKWHTITYKSI